ncbi:dihydroorotase [Stella humosa]|uniref:Dihydroorotase n=1 Tax=Stella humosa TaxID=94 RepID=A0A3N1LX00_9PROT|nr:dihydroorotase [Stella humosa]ROP99713.1 dihydroorotase [Stella humosa]BBK31060.1 dihydroorotase [Stella humosa]
MSQSFDLVVTGGQTFTPMGLLETDVGIRGGRIVAIGGLATAAAAQRIDARGLTVLPGVIDTQVHFREPGSEHKEDLATGTAAAAMGGVTAIFEMPNTKPLTLTAADLGEKLRLAAGRTQVDHAFFMGGSAANAEHLAVLERLPGCCGVKVFMGSSTGDLLVEDDATLAAILKNGVRRMAVHAEDEARLKARRHLVEGGAPPTMHPEWRDEQTALLATQRLVGLARQARRKVHVLHITTAEEMEFLAGHKDFATVETTPQHLTLAAPECYERLGTYAQMNPPIRSARHREALWRAVADGVVDVIGSDHAPHTRAEKDKPYPESPSGMPGVQTLVPLLLDHVAQGRMTLARFVDLTSAGPQRLYDIAGKGRIALGYDADLTIVDLNARRRIENSWIVSKCGWTPFDGMDVTGWPIATVVRGNIVMRDDALVGPPIGRPVRFADCMPG